MSEKIFIDDNNKNCVDTRTRTVNRAADKDGKRAHEGNIQYATVHNSTRKNGN